LKNKWSEAIWKETKSFQEDVLSLQRQSEKLKSAMDEMVRINGAAKMNDYVALQSGLKENSPICNFKPIWAK
jgi:hypothetical protein